MTSQQLAAQTGGARASFEYWLTVYRRTWRGSIVTSLLSPVMFLAAMGVGLGSLIDSHHGNVAGVRYAVYLAPGVLAAAVMQTMVGESTWPVLGAIKWAKTFYAMLATPLVVRDILLGHLGYIVLRAFIVSASFTIVTAAFGLAHSAVGAILAMLAAVLVGSAFAAPVYAFSASRQREHGFVLLYRFGIIPLFLFSGTFFPISQLPGALQPVAWITPLWHGVSLCRDLALGRGSALVMLGHAGYLVMMTTVGIVLAQRALARRLQL